VPLATAVARCFPRIDLDSATAQGLRHGRPFAATRHPGVVGAFAPDGEVLAIVEDDGDLAKPVVVFAPA
jgi:tRNA pseudouridine55 synthase